MSGTLYVVFAMDTEGPATDAQHLDLLRDWEAIDKALATLFSNGFRSRLTDTEGRPLVMSWFMLYWTGFTTNPVKRDFGYHKVLDHYRRTWGKAMERFGDGIYWHYHHPPRSEVGNEWNPDWLDNQEYHNILNRMVLDRAFFPSVFRAGGTIETNATSHWLEQWIPFDYSNRSGELNLAKREADGRLITELFDWSRAPDDWSHYHPDHEDYQRRGAMKRVILRSLDLQSGAHVLRQEEIEQAFDRANAGHDTVFSCFDHDFRDRTQAIDGLFFDRLRNAARRFPRVTWRYANALEAAQAVSGQRNGHPPQLTARFDGDVLIVESDRSLFGPRPYVVLKRGEHYECCVVEPKGKQRWMYRLADPTSGIMLGLAGSDDGGRVGLARYRLVEGHLEAA